MKNERVRNFVLILLALAFFGALGWYQYDQSLPLSVEECRSTMFAPVSTKEMGYWSMASLENDLRECGYDDREIAIWHAGDFAVDYTHGNLPTEKGDGLAARYKHIILFDKREDIPSYFKTVEPVPSCMKGEYYHLSFVQEFKEDGSWTMFNYNGGPDEWDLKCVGDEE